MMSPQGNSTHLGAYVEEKEKKKEGRKKKRKRERKKERKSTGNIGKWQKKITIYKKLLD